MTGIKDDGSLSARIATIIAINQIMASTTSDKANKCTTPSINDSASIDARSSADNVLGGTVEVLQTPAPVEIRTAEPSRENYCAAPSDTQSPCQRELLGIVTLKSKFEEGYDSDGESGPWCDMEALEGEQDFEEDDLLEVDFEEDELLEVGIGADIEKERSKDIEPCTNVAESIEDDLVMSPDTGHIAIEVDVLKKMKVVDLKSELKKRGQPTSGNKSQLLTRLIDALDNKIPVGHRKEAVKKSSAPSQMKAFPNTAYWRVLKPKTESVDEPQNSTFKNPRAPTIPEEDAEYVPLKHDFDIEFERPAFTGTKEKYRMNRRGIPIKDKDGKFIFDTETRTKGCVNPSFTQKQKLGIDSTPDEFVSVFLPFGKNQHASKEYISAVGTCMVHLLVK